MEKDTVHEFVGKYCEDFLQAISEHIFTDLVVDDIEEFDSLFGGNSFKENLDIVPFFFIFRTARFLSIINLYKPTRQY